ncbi:LAME_0C00650g1_1 [Lachancea meyersii CBS 8951]|uniref:LAME_0C00650g1_1 n=1 Tax=Lachancea meyersii CBS 8951 TaxID=1266667 RepID=A0A1G4IYV4_9SACH|nr:LAME_0C00650g1_1 [Lachancea meyersii CBS 8951]
MSTSGFKLSAVLSGHEQDVKAVVAIDTENISSCSRDGTVRVWKKGFEGIWQGNIAYQSEKFVNSLCFDIYSQLLFCGGQDTLINSVETRFDGLSAESKYVLVGHQSNVCVLNSSQGYVLSGSWDSTARVWFEGAIKHGLIGHQASVWDVKMLPQVGTYLTASADRSIKLWSGEKVVKSFDNIHSDVVRYLDINSTGDQFVSCSNDGTVKINDMEGRTLQTLTGHESFVYCVKYMANGDIVSCGEDRSVRVWGPDGTVKQVIRIPAVSVWTLDIMENGDIVVGSSDSIIRIFTRDPSRVACQKELEQFAEEVEKTAINSQTSGFDESNLSSADILKTAGKEGQIVVVKSPSGVKEAHQFSQGKWTKVGDVVGSTGNDQKKEYDGKMYDYVFDVDVQEGAPPLKLPFNANDNPYQAADDFLAKYELPASYREDVVRFLITNTGGTELQRGDVATAPQSTDIPEKEFAPVETNMAMLPVTTYLEISTCDPDAIFSAIAKLNEKEKTFDDEDLAALGAGLHNIAENSDLLFAHASMIRFSWQNKIPAYDIMRLIVTHLPEADAISEFVEEGLGCSNLQLELLTIRGLANCFQNKKWGKELMSKSAVYDSIFQTIDADRQQTAKTGNLAIAIATLIFNYTVMILRDQNLDLLPTIADALNNKYGPSTIIQNSEEAAYRALVAYGNLATIESTLLQFAPSVTWVKSVKNNYGHLARFDQVFKDLNFS